MAILQQDGSGYVQANVSDTVVVTPGDGNRRFILVCCTESGSDSTCSATLDGETLSVVSDGTDDAENEQGGFARVTLMELRELNMPSNGSKDLEITWGTPGDDHAAYWYLVDGVDQEADVGSALTTGETTTGTTLSGNVAVGDAGALLIVGAYKNNADSGLTLNSPASVVVDQSVDASGGGAELLAGHKLGGHTPGTVAVTQSGASSNRRVLVAIVLEPTSAIPKKEQHQLSDDTISFTADWIETRVADAGDYVARVTCDCNRLVRLDLELWVSQVLQSSDENQVTPSTSEAFDIPFTTLVSDTDVRLSIQQVTGGNSGVDLTISGEVLREDGTVP